MDSKIDLIPADERNLFSQCGEDGIIEKIFAHWKPKFRTACEFGAWDGKHASNTAKLHDEGWRVFFIEGNGEKFKDLQKNYGQSERAVLLRSWVGFEGPSTLDELAAKHFTSGIDFLSIDIDGDDYHVLESLKMRPRVICIEFNPMLGPVCEFINPRGQFKGTSLMSFWRWAQKSSYDLIYCTRTNAFFIDRNCGHPFTALKPTEAFQAWDILSVVGSFYDGENKLLAGGTNPWDRLPSCAVKNAPRFLWGSDEGARGLMKISLRYVLRFEFYELFIRGARYSRKFGWWGSVPQEG